MVQYPVTFFRKVKGHTLLIPFNSTISIAGFCSISHSSVQYRACTHFSHHYLYLICNLPVPVLSLNYVCLTSSNSSSSYPTHLQHQPHLKLLLGVYFHHGSQCHFFFMRTINHMHNTRFTCFNILHDTKCQCLSEITLAINSFNPSTNEFLKLVGNSSKTVFCLKCNGIMFTHFFF